MFYIQIEIENSFLDAYLIFEELYINYLQSIRTSNLFYVIKLIAIKYSNDHAFT